MENQKPEVRLTGKWRISRKFKTNGSDEQNLIVFSGKDHIVDFPADGIITERHGNDVSTVMYTYNPDTRTIAIQLSQRTVPSPVSGSVGNIYRVIPLNDREMYFMSPSSIEEDSDEFEIILLERI